MGILSFVVLLCIIIFIRLEVESAEKPRFYRIIYEKIENCKDVGTGEISWMTNFTKLENGNYNFGFIVKTEINKETKMCIEGRELTSEGYTKVHQFNCHTCSHMWAFMSDFFTSFLIAAGVTPKACDFPKGVLVATDWDGSQSLRSMPKMIINKFKFIFSFYREDERLGCNIIYVDFVRK